MAVINYWTGATDGDVNVAGNWTDNVPIAADFLIFDGHGSQSVDSNMATLVNIDLEGILVTPDYTGSIGSEANPFEFKCTDGLVILRGRGSEYNLMCGGVNDADAFIFTTVIDMTSSTTIRLYSMNNDANAVSEFTHVYVVSGVVTLIGTNHTPAPAGSAMELGTYVRNLVCMPRVSGYAAVTVNIEDGCYNFDDTEYTNLTATGGSIITATALNLIENMGAKYSDVSV